MPSPDEPFVTLVIEPGAVREQRLHRALAAVEGAGCTISNMAFGRLHASRARAPSAALLIPRKERHKIQRAMWTMQRAGISAMCTDDKRFANGIFGLHYFDY